MLEFIHKAIRTYSIVDEVIRLNDKSVVTPLNDVESTKLRRFERKLDKQEEAGLGIMERFGGYMAVARHPIKSVRLQTLYA
jgi:hypothetical protein